ncbi:unnamed protein product, partial [marine sediment metagenome]
MTRLYYPTTEPGLLLEPSRDGLVLVLTSDGVIEKSDQSAS